MKRLAILLLLTVAVVPSVALAQPGAGRRPPAGRLDEIKKKIRALRAYTLTEELALDEASAGKVFPVLAKFDDELDKVMAARAGLQRQLNHPPADPKALDRLIDEAVANQRALWDLETKKLGELRAVLTPQQTARLLVVLPALERRIQNRLRKALKGNQGGRGGAGGAGDDDDDDDLPAPRRQGHP